MCPLEIGSFGHPQEDIRYRWASRPLSMETFNLAQYTMSNWSHGAAVTAMKNGNHSIIFLSFQFDRTLGFYILQIYIPLTIIVMSSWVSFWLIKTDLGQENAARTGLGATCTLAVVTIGFGGKTKPQVAYATALDIFVIICFISVFFALAEFALLSFLDFYIRRLKQEVVLQGKMKVGRRWHKEVHNLPARLQGKGGKNGNSNGEKIRDGGSGGKRSDGVPALPKRLRDRNGNYGSKFPQKCRQCRAREGAASWRAAGLSWLRGRGLGKQLRHWRLYHHTTEVLHDIDSCCRKLFPSVFVLLNLIYWTTYVYII